MVGGHQSTTVCNRLVGVLVKVSSSTAADPASIPPCSGNCPSRVATLQGTWRYKVSAGTGCPGVSILWLGEIESLICNLHLSVATRTCVWADPSQRYTNMLLGREATDQLTNMLERQQYDTCSIWISDHPYSNLTPQPLYYVDSEWHEEGHVSISNQRRHAGRDGDGAKSKDQRLDDQKGLTSISFWINIASTHFVFIFVCIYYGRPQQVVKTSCLLLLETREMSDLAVVLRDHLLGYFSSAFSSSFSGHSRQQFLTLLFVLFCFFFVFFFVGFLLLFVLFDCFFQFFSDLFGISCRHIWHWFSASWHFSLALLAFFFSLLHTSQRTPFVLPTHSLSETLLRSLKVHSHHITQGQWIIVQVPHTTCSMLCPGPVCTTR